jgi:prolyl 4-hydroxylase
MAKTKKIKLKELCDYPYIGYADGVLSDDDCNHIINSAKDKLVRSKVDGPTEIVSETRTSSQAWLGYDDGIIADICTRVATIIGVPSTHAEQMQVVYYKKGEKYDRHHDAYDISTVEGKRATRGWGQRTKTALLYLNDVEAGGETEFPMVDVVVKPKRGSMVVFDNIDHEHRTVPLHSSLHAALPVEKGFKWACNLWFHENDAKFQGRDVSTESQLYMSDEEIIRMLDTLASATKDQYGEHSRRMQYISQRFQSLLSAQGVPFK